jgi:fructokinase
MTAISKPEANPPSGPVLVGIETGGTKILCRLTSLDGGILTDQQFTSGSPSEVVETLVGIIGATTSLDRLGAVGVASFGPLVVDPASPDVGRMLATPKVGWTGFNLAQALQDRLGAPVRVDTDVNAAALAEQQIGAGKGLHAVAYVTVGTGIGGGLAIGETTLKGALHPEIGHLRMRRAPGDDQPSQCPFHADCAEGLTSGPAVRLRLAGRSLAEAPEVCALIADYLGQLCASLLLAWSPQRIVLGGGVMAHPDLLPAIEARLKIELNAYGAGVVAQAPGYVAAAALEHSGLEGALILARTLWAERTRA